MVSLRCKMVVKAELEDLSLPYKSIELGEIELEDEPNEEQKQLLRENLLKSGLELADDDNNAIAEQIAVCLTQLIHYSEDLVQVDFQEYLGKSFQCDYKSLSAVFSEAKGISIQQFIISHKIERAKELLLYEKLKLAEIAYKLNYSSVAHLSNQFKKLTGHSPSFYLQLKKKRTGNADKR